jgi:hypothetical protein
VKGIPPFHQRLKPRFSYGFFNRKMNNADLSDDATLAELNVTCGDSFFLLRRSRNVIGSRGTPHNASIRFCFLACSGINRCRMSGVAHFNS